MDQAAKDALLEQFRRCLEDIEAAPEPEEASGQDTDLFAVFVELAAIRNEVRTESRLVKDALEQFRAAFAALESSRRVLEDQLRRQEAEAAERERTLLRPLLLELLELRDRLAAGAAAPQQPSRWRDRIRRRARAESEAWREGIAITLRRLDGILAERRVVPIAVLGRPFDPRLARAVGTVCDSAHPVGVVLQELRAGFRWADEVLRAADVIVNATETKTQEDIP